MGKYFKKVWWRYVLGLSCMLISIALDIALPLVIMTIIDDVIVGGQVELLTRNLLYILGIGFGRAITQYVKEFHCDMAGCVIAESLRKDMMGHIHTLSRSFFDKNNTGELMARVKDDAGKIWDLFGFVGMLFIEAILYLIGVIVCMLRLDPGLSAVSLSFLPILGFIVFLLSRKLDRLYGQLSEDNATLTTVIEENISGVRTVKAFAREKAEIEKFDEKNIAYISTSRSLEEAMAKYDPYITLIPKVMQAITLFVGGYMAIRGNITYGLLVAFIQYSGNIVWPIENMGWITNLLSQGIVSLRKTGIVRGATPEIVGTDEYKEGGINGELEFRNVSFTLNDNQILSNISFCLRPGKTLGIMGATGSGKSTVVNLIQRFYDTTEGDILLGGKNIKELSLSAVHGFSSVVPQDVFLFSDTIRDNVALGQHDVLTPQMIQTCLDKAHASEFVSKLSEKEETVIGERGIGLSGGQKQRISLARAWAKPSQVLILDDSTSALDMETERLIQAELREKKELSKIIIAHRISSVKDADEILVLENGSIAERGTHDELMRHGGLYKSTYEAQYGNYREAMKLIGKEELICQ